MIVATILGVKRFSPVEPRSTSSDSSRQFVPLWGLPDAPGPFLLQGDHGRVWFANIWVLPMEPAKE